MLRGAILKWSARIFGGVAIAALGTAGAALGYLYWRYPIQEPARDLRVPVSPERVLRGRYLAEHAAGCIACHSRRDWTLYSGPVVPGTEGAGDRYFLDPSFHSANITPAALAQWSDGELIRAISSGVGRTGAALDPRMPWEAFSRLSPDDLEALVAYLRTLAPIVTRRPDNQVALSRRLFARTLPRPYRPRPSPGPNDTVAWGRILAGLGSCTFCHGADLSGGRRFVVPGGGDAVARNLTPDPTGIGEWSRENFVGVFKAFASPEARRIPVGEPPVNTVMPWTAYAGMTDPDLGALYDYLRSLPPVSRVVERAARPAGAVSGRMGAPGPPVAAGAGRGTGG